MIVFADKKNTRLKFRKNPDECRSESIFKGTQTYPSNSHLAPVIHTNTYGVSILFCIPTIY